MYLCYNKGMKILRQVKKNKGVEVEYRKRLEKLIDAMDKSVMYWILADYGNRTAREMSIAIQKRVKQWNDVFGDKAGDMALWFANSVRKHTEIGFKMALGEQGIDKSPKVSQDTFNAVKIENEDLIRSIPEKYFTGIETVAMMSLLYNWDKEELKENIEKRHEVTLRRAKTISSDQANKANNIFMIDMCERMNIMKAIWTYTYRSEKPRESHIAANGTIFDIDKGCLIDGEYILPGELYGCKCSFTPIIPEVGDDVRKEIEKNVYYKWIARGAK